MINIVFLDMYLNEKSKNWVDTLELIWCEPYEFS
jgi:hypothetical protein